MKFSQAEVGKNSDGDIFLVLHVYAHVPDFIQYMV